MLFSAKPLRTRRLGGGILPQNELTAETPSTQRRRRVFFRQTQTRAEPNHLIFIQFDTADLLPYYPICTSGTNKLLNRSSLLSNVGAWLSLVERTVRDREVGGSNPLAPTN